MKQATFDYVNHDRIRSWNQPVLSNEGKVYCSRKQRELLKGLKLTTDRHPSTTRPTRFPLCHAPPPPIDDRRITEFDDHIMNAVPYVFSLTRKQKPIPVSFVTPRTVAHVRWYTCFYYKYIVQDVLENDVNMCVRGNKRTDT